MIEGGEVYCATILQFGEVYWSLKWSDTLLAAPYTSTEVASTVVCLEGGSERVDCLELVWCQGKDGMAWHGMDTPAVLFLSC